MNSIAHLDTAVLDTVAKFFRTMQKAGADFTGPMQSVAQRRNLVSYLGMGCPKISDNGDVLTIELPEGHELARLILGDDYITPEEIATAYGVSYTDEQLEHFEGTLPDTQTILWLRANGYMLIAGPSVEMKLWQVRELDKQLFYSKIKVWYAEDNESFARTDVLKAGEWLAIRKEEVPNSFSKTWEEQQSLITEVEYVPNAAEVSYAVTIYYKVRGIRLLRGKYVGTSSITVSSYHVYVGNFVDKGLYVNDYWDDDRNGSIGISSARK